MSCVCLFVFCAYYFSTYNNFTCNYITVKLLLKYQTKLADFVLPLTKKSFEFWLVRLAIPLKNHAPEECFSMELRILGWHGGPSLTVLGHFLSFLIIRLGPIRLDSGY